MEKKMYKLLVADDEYWTREKIRNMLNWEEYQISFMNPAQDGEEVLRIAREDRPDILITDINMPFVNGVDLVRRIKKEYPDIVVFVISGYDDFEYVKQTLMDGAINYLLKPVARIDLIGALSRALEIISEKEENEKQTVKTASLIQDREMSLLVEKENSVIPTINFLSESNDMVGSSMMLIKIHELQELMGKYEYDMNFLSYSIKKLIKQISGMENLLIFNYIYRSNEFLIVTEAEVSEQRHMAIKILNALKELTQSPVTIAVSEPSYSIESLHNAYVQSISVLMARPFKKENAILFCQQEGGITSRDVRNYMTQELERQLRSMLNNSSKKAIMDFLRDVAGLASCEGKDWKYIEVKQIVKKISTIFLDVVSENGSSASMGELDEMEQMMDKVLEKLDGEQVLNLLEEMLLIVLSEKMSEISGNIKDVVREAAQFIDNNYYEEMTLVSLASKYCVESSYFSRMFKQETGKNLMLYITDKRIEKAKEIMRQSELSMAEIAFMVGYDDYTYFSKVFKKVTGVSPREYRNGWA
ncbi:MAG: response regulator [Eubacterium sp.]|nr:response regulator [Eubacterium sp.]